MPGAPPGTAELQLGIRSSRVPPCRPPLFGLQPNDVCNSTTTRRSVELALARTLLRPSHDDGRPPFHNRKIGGQAMRFVSCRAAVIALTILVCATAQAASPPIFAGGFESGTLCRWPSSTPVGCPMSDVSVFPSRVDDVLANPTTQPLPPLELAITGRRPDGWYTLSQITVE